MLKSNGKQAKLVAILSLDGSVPLYSASLSYISWKLQHIGVNILKIGCEGFLSHCTSINSLGARRLTEEEKKTICEKCQGDGQRSITSQVTENVIEADKLLADSDQEYIDLIKESLLNNRSAFSALRLNHLEIPYSKIAFFDLSISNKINGNSYLNDSLIEIYLEGITDLFIIKNTLNRIISKYNFSHLIYVNGNYSQNTFCRNYLKNKNVIALSLENQFSSRGSLNRVFLATDRLALKPDGLLNPNLNFDGKEISTFHANALLNVFAKRIVGDQFNAYTDLTSATATSSDVRELKHFLKKYPSRHTFFLSSEDELSPHIATHDAARNPDYLSKEPWESQLEFTKYLIGNAQNYPETGFIVRLHPRMAVNKRDSFESPEHLMYKDLFENIPIPENVLVLMGDSTISSYFLVGISDIVLVAWSTIGIEALLLGARVVSVFPTYLFYPLSKLSCQPVNFDQVVRSIFTQSEFGRANDKGLLHWAVLAYEQQFFPIVVQRSTEKGLWGWFWEKYFQKQAQSGRPLLRSVIDRLISNAQPASTTLLEPKLRYATRLETLFSLSLLERYRRKYRGILTAYGQRLGLSDNDF
jgi:hypothetical protein